jgi:ribonuclease HI
LELAKKKGCKALLVEGDSQLVILQMAKRWQVKDMRMRTHWEKAQDLLKYFDFVAIKHVYRDFNQKADALSKEGLRRRAHFERA